jgi:hypothetical protein
MPGVFRAADKDTTQHGCVFDSVTVDFISLWKLKFLAYLLNVTKRFVMRIISYVCNYSSLQWMVLSAIVTPGGARRGTGKED